MSRHYDDFRGYHDWLVSQIDSPERDLARNYTILMDILDEIPFEAHNKMDENLIPNAISMRNEYFFDETFCEKNLKNVTFLEIFVEILRKISDFVLVEPGNSSVAPEIWYEIMKNLHFLHAKNDDFEFFWTREEIFETVQLVLKKSRKINVFGPFDDPKLPFWDNLNRYAGGRFL